MDFVDFLLSLKSSEYILSQPVLLFKTDSYPALLFLRVLQAVRMCEQVTCITVNAQEFDEVTMQSQLATQFLGAKLLYWLGDIENYQQKNAVINLLHNYQGPHVIWLFAQEQIIDVPTISINDKIALSDAQKLYVALFGQLTENKKKLIENFFHQEIYLNIEEVCFLMHYVMLMNISEQKEFTQHWLGQLLAPDHSLFLLSTHFFARDKKNFFSLWRAMADHYPLTFWISFWSEQIFKATNFIALTRSKDFIQAKQASHRLPFSFIKKDWQKHKVENLIEMHQLLVDLDFKLKNGFGVHGIDLFYTRFFNINF